MKLRHAGKIAYAVGLAILAALLVVASTRIDGARLVADLSTARPLWVIGAVVCYVAQLPLWAVQWQLLAPRVERNDFPHMLGVVAMTSTLQNTSLTLVGEAASVVLLVLRVGVSRAAALSVLAMDQLLVGLAKVVLLVVAALLLPLPAWLSAGVRTLVAGVAVLLVGCLIGAWQHAWISARLDGVLTARVTSFLSQMGVALEPLRSPMRGGGALALALIKKGAEVAAIVCVQRSFGLSLPLADAVLVLTAVSIFTVVPLIPANLGIYEGVITIAYTHLGVPAELALGMAVVQHAGFFVAVGIPGFVWFARTGISRRAVAASPD